MANISIEDKDLMKAIATGDQEAFGILYRKYWPLLYLHVYRMLQDAALAEDLVQETFTWIWQHAPELEIHSQVSAYLYGSVRHSVLQQFRKEKVRSAYLADLSVFAKEGHTEVEEWVIYNELAAEIEKEIARMPPRMREVFELSRKEMLSHRQIAEQLGIAESTVREQIKRALKHLRWALKDRPYLFFAFLGLFR